MANSMETSFLIIKMIGALALILGVMGTMVWAIKRFGPMGLSQKKGLISIIESRPFLPKKYLSVVKVGKNYYLIGSTDSQIALLDTLNPSQFEGFKDHLSKKLKEAGNEE